MKTRTFLNLLSILAVFATVGTVATLAVTLTQAAPARAVDSTLVEWGELVEFFGFSGGDGAAVVLLDEYTLGFVYISPEGYLSTDRATLAGKPDLLIVNVCGKWVQAASEEGGSVYRYRWELPVESGMCVVRYVRFPVVGN